MNAAPPLTRTDQECLEAFRRERAVSHLRPLVDRYLPLVYASALRRTGNVDEAAEATRAVFLVLVRRARRIRKKTVLAGWLFHVTGVACRKICRTRNGPRRWFPRWFSRRPRSLLPTDAPLWARIAPEIDRALEGLSSKQRNAVLLRAFLNHDLGSTARILRTKERRVEKRLARGLGKLTKRLRKHGGVFTVDVLAHACSNEACAGAVPEGLNADIVELLEASRGKHALLPLARRTLTTLAFARWRRRIAIGLPAFFLLLATAAGVAWHIDSLSGHSRLISMFLIWSMRNEPKRVPGLGQAARPWPTHAAGPRLSAAKVRNARDIYQTTNVWHTHLTFSRAQWKAAQPKRIGALPNFLQPDGTAILRHPEAHRSGLAGVLGFDFEWTHGDFHFGDVAFTNVGARLKGNGTWLGSLYGDKRAFKVDLNKYVDRQKIAGLDELTFNNLVIDQSYMSDTLAYEFFRDAGVPAPRTAYAWMTISVAEKWQDKPLGLYVLVESVDEEFAGDRFGSKKTPIFKPVTYQLFEHVGDDWSAYAEIYDLKTRATQAQEKRVIDFSRLVSHASDEEFAGRVGDFLDLDEFARFLAGEVILSSYDSILANGQNFYIYLDPRSNKFGFIPWDLDLAWGGFFLLGSRQERERASIWHPWVGENRFIERVMAVPEFRRIYRGHLEDFLARLFVPERLHRRVDEMAAVVRGPVAAESDFRLNKFEQAVGTKPAERPQKHNPHGSDRPAYQLKRFIDKRAASVRQQLDGKSDGIILQRRGN
jgi:RNA polymerase sigma factor (sigma-70 family)